MTTIAMSPALHASLLSLIRADARKRATAVMSDKDSKEVHVGKAMIHVEAYQAWRECAEVVSSILRRSYNE
jgi:hypothetical protein